MATPLVPTSPTSHVSSKAPARCIDVTLVRGQSFHGYLSRGTVLHVRTGHAVLTPASRWLAASIWRPAVPLAAGQVHVVQTSGWITLASDTGANMTCRTEADASGTAAPAARRLAVSPLRALRQRFGF